MSLIRKIYNRLRYDRLHHYPELAPFEREAALNRLKTYEREEREALRPWPTIASIVGALPLVLWLTLAYMRGFDSPKSRMMFWLLLLMVQIPLLLFQWWVHQRVRRRVAAKVAAELHDGRLWKCVECGYDLRASNERCPECGASVWVERMP